MNDELARIVAVVEESRLWRAVAAPLTAASAAWSASVTARACRASASHLSSSPQAHRVRFAALTIAFAAAVHAAVLPLVPQYSRPGIPVPWLILVIGVALLAGALAEAMVAAWPASVVGTMTRRILAQVRAENRS